MLAGRALNVVASTILLYWYLALWAFLSVPFDPRVWCIILDLLEPQLHHFAVNWCMRFFQAFEAILFPARALNFNCISEFVLRNLSAISAWAPFCSLWEINEGLHDVLLVLCELFRCEDCIEDTFWYDHVALHVRAGSIYYFGTICELRLTESLKAL